MTPHWGPVPLDTGGARFSLWAPDLDALALEVDGAAPVAMMRCDEGWFFADSADAGAGTRYRFRLPSGQAVPDPASRLQADDVHGWSVVVDQHAYRWQSDGWRGRPWETMVIEEVHAGTSGGYAGVAERLEGLRDLGVTAIELMPVAQFGGMRGWGYDGVLPFAPHPAYGTPDDLRALVDRAHALGLSVFLDVVYNHFGPDGNYLGAYASDFFDPEVHTPWGGAVAVDRAPVRQFFLDNTLMWLRDYCFDGLRLDAVHAIGNAAFLDDLACEIRRALPDRHVHLVLENEENDADRLSAERYDAQWNDDFHNVLHVLLTGETSAYYQDFSEAPAEKLARCLAQGFIYQGDPSPNHDGKLRGRPSDHLPPTRFVSFLQNHDQVGNRAMGERLTLLADPDALRAATALLLLAPQVPLLFTGDSDGSRSPFLFFTDFHDELADAVREGRRREFAKFDAFSDPAARASIPDPNAHETFERSRPEPGPDADAWRALYRELLAIRHKHIVPRLADARAIGAEAIGDKAVAARWQLGTAELLIVVNLGDAPAQAPRGDGAPLFALGEPGAATSFAAWLA